ncbi:MAG: LytR C-terminal domain-containing protein [Actinomycetota bacterium]
MGRHSIGQDRSFLRSFLFFALKWVGLAIIPLLLLRGLWGLMVPEPDAGGNITTADPTASPVDDPAGAPVDEPPGDGGEQPAATPSPAVTEAPGPGSKMQVLNGSDKVGQAQSLATLLRKSGREVVNVEKAARIYDKTTILYQPGFEQAAQDLAEVVGAQVQAAPQDAKLDKSIPLVVIVGNDYTPPDAAAVAPAAGAGASPSATPTATTTAVALQVLNGTDVKGLAGRAAEKLRSQGYEVRAVSNAVNKYDKTFVYYQPGFQRNASEVVAVLGTGTARAAPDVVTKDVPLTVVVGKDYT